MKLIVITKGDSPETRDALEIASNIASESYEVETLDWDSDEAATIAAIHDVYSQPAFLVLSDDGVQIELWQGENMPLTSDIKHMM